MRSTVGRVSQREKMDFERNQQENPPLSTVVSQVKKKVIEKRKEIKENCKEILGKEEGKGKQRRQNEVEVSELRDRREGEKIQNREKKWE
jgi:hypothetical protein